MTATESARSLADRRSAPKRAIRRQITACCSVASNFCSSFFRDNRGIRVFARLFSVRSATVWLIAASLFFYAYWDAALLTLLLGSIVFNFVCGKRLFIERSRALLWAGLFFNIGLLAYFKYAGFFVENVESALNMEIANLDIVLPLAISFFTFQQIAYLADVYQGKAAEPTFSAMCCSSRFSRS